MTSEPSSERVETYNKSLSEYGESPQSLKWQNYKAAARRFRQLIADLDVAGKSVLDAGCGMGDFLPYIYSKSDDFTYLGVDITPGFVDIARKRYQGHDFQVFDPFEQDLEQTFDIVVSSGVMNASTPEWETKRKEMIEKLFSYANEVLAFNMAGSTKESKAIKNMGYANLQDILAFCMTLTPKVIVRNQYHAQDFTILMFK